MSKPAPPSRPSPARLVTLDFVRGLAVLGILLMNIVGFAWPSAAVLSPQAPLGPSGSWDDELFLIQFVLIDGKLRGLFSLLFGAGMVLFLERACARGEDGWALQMCRLAWLAVFGLAHRYLLWWGDILFLYAACGCFALTAVDWSVRRLLAVAGGLFALGVVWLGAMTVGDAAPWLAGEPSASSSADFARRLTAEAVREARAYSGPWLAMVVHQVTREWQWPVSIVATSGFETVPLILIGMALLRSGLLREAWPTRRVLALAAGGIAVGLAATVPLAWWLQATGFAPEVAVLVNLALVAPGRLAMTIGYAALAVLVARRTATTALGERLVAAGRMAFSNYLGTSLVMAALFHGWGLGLYARYSRLELLAFVALGWVLMLAWSKPWLRHFRQGPLEWLWRCLVRRRFEPIQRLAIAKDSH